MPTPILNAGFSPALKSLLKNALTPAGISVASLVVDGSISNAAMEAIAIEALDTSLGTWQFSLDAGSTWLTIRADLLNSTTNSLGLLLGPTSLLRLLPFGELSGNLSDALTFRAWDGVTGSAGSYVVTTPGVGAFSTDSDTASLTVTSVNDPPTFAAPNGTGKVVAPMGSAADLGYAIAAQPDGKIIVAGNDGGWSAYAVWRLNADGSADPTFGDGSAVLLNLGSVGDAARSVLVQPDGKILVSGSSTNSDDDMSIARLNVDGSLDTTFDGDGMKVIEVGDGQYDHSSGMALQADGQILLVGETNVGPRNDFSIVRLDASNGAPDTSFSGDGKLIQSLNGNDSYARSVAVQADGKIVVAGYSSVGGNLDFALIRLTAAGVLDTTFDGDGIVTLDVAGSSDIAENVLIQPDGRILVAGSSISGGKQEFSIVRLLSNGALDTDFSGDGIQIVTLGTGNNPSYGMALQVDGKIVLSGISSSGGNDDYGVVRLNADGSPDSTFNGTGMLTLAVGAGNMTDAAMAVAVQPDGNIVLAGYTGAGVEYDFSVVRLTSNGSLDTTFGSTPTNTLGGTLAYTENGAQIVLDSNVQIYDAELAALNSGAGNYNGAILTLERSGGAIGQDVFSATGNLSPLIEGNFLVVGGTAIGAVDINSAGYLSLTFNASATQALVNSALQQIAYSNGSDNPGGSAQISWTFNDGNTSYVVFNGDDRAQTSGPVSTQTDNVTLEGWFNWDGGGAYQTLLYNGDTGSQGYGITGNVSGGTLQLIWLVGGVNYLDTDGFIAAGEWHHVALTRSAGIFRFFLDGVEGNVALSNSSVNAIQAGATTMVGGNPVVPAENFHGFIGEVRIWDVARSASEIAGARFATLAGNETGLVADWRFQEGSGASSFDYAAPQVNLSLIGTPLWQTNQWGPGSLQVATGSVLVNVTAVNDPPVLTPNASAAFLPVAENTANPTGITVSGLITNVPVTDPDGPAKAIAIEAVNTSLGTWQYSLDAGSIWLAIDAAALNSTTNSLALLLDPGAMLRLLPFGELSGSLDNGLTFRAWDVSAGSAGQYVVTTPGSGAFSANSDTASKIGRAHV